MDKKILTKRLIGGALFGVGIYTGFEEFTTPQLISILFLLMGFAIQIPLQKQK